MPKHICPWWLAYTFDNPLRRLFHKPEKIFAPYLREGMKAADLGCGMGYFSIGMARLVGDSGKVIAVDIQQKMLDILMKRAERNNMAHRIRPVLCDQENLGVKEPVDFALAFWMIHETTNEQNCLHQVHNMLKADGKLLVAEPKMHVTRREFDKTLTFAGPSGLIKIDEPDIDFSHTALFKKQLIP